MPNYRETEVKKLDERITSTQEKIAQYDSKIENANRMIEHHPWHWDRERQKFQALKNVELERLASLIDQRRNALPPGGGGNDWRPATWGFTGSDH